MRETLRGSGPGSAGIAAFIVLSLVACSTAVPSSPGSTENGISQTSPPGQTAPAASASPNGEGSPSDEGPSRASLITQAVADGRINPATGLLYRAYGLFGLPDLPVEFAAGVPRADDGLFAEMVELMPTLSPEEQAKFQPFLVRPTEPNSIFAAQPAAVVGGAMVAATTHPSATCSNWSDSGSFDTRFKIWACRDQDAAAAERDIGTLSAILAEIWVPMTKAEPDGMGPPLPDGHGPTVSSEFGGDARIDFYALNLGQVFFRDGNNSIPATAAAAAAPSPPYTAEDGVPRNSSSGFVMVNRNRLGETVAMKQDLIHEFFHVLQFAHNRKAPHKGAVSHWFTEASAVWAETYYLRAQSKEPHRWFVTKFQTSLAGLEDADVDHQYGAYVWPFFMEQEKGATAVFKAWAGIDPVGSGDFPGVTEAVSAQLAFDANFRDFAVRNLNMQHVLQPAGLKLYPDLDSNFYNVPPQAVASGRVSPGAPYLSPSQSIPPLAGRYFDLEIAEPARLVTISTVQLSPGGQVDADAFVHVLGGTWESRPVSGGVLKFCRDDDGDDIDQVYLVVSNHARDGNVTGFIEASAKDTCTGEPYLAGTISWNAFFPKGFEQERATTVSGSVSVVLHGDSGGTWVAERGEGSTYTYSVTIEGCSPDIHQSGVVETGIQGFEPEWHIANLLSTGARPGTDDDLNMSLTHYEETEITCISPYDGRAYPATFGSVGMAFPGCMRLGNFTAEFDGVENYVIDCEASGSMYGAGVTGSVTGTLHPLEGPAPIP